MIRNTLRHLAILAVLFAASSALRAGTNTWTGSSPISTNEVPGLVAADPGNPYVVYASFGGDLFRSADGGRTWRLLKSFSSIQALLVHPADSSAVYVASGSVVFKSADAGETWVPTLHTRYGYPFTTLAAIPAAAASILAGSEDGIYRYNSDESWSVIPFALAITSLVIHPRDPSIGYAGAIGYSYFVDYPSFGKTIDGGATWTTKTPENLGAISAVGIDAVENSTIYAATVAAWGREARGVFRSDDAGESWTSASTGLPEGSVLSLAVDPRISGLLYAGTISGIYRSRDGGRSWTPFSQRVAGTSILSLSIAADSRRLHASTSHGAYDFEIASGPMDVAAGPAGTSRLLEWNADRSAIGTVDSAGRWTSGPFGDSSAIWTATAIASGPGDHTHVLWQSGDGRSGIEIIGSSGRLFSTVFQAMTGWIATDLSVRVDGKTEVLWTGTGGRMRIATVDSSGASRFGPSYGPAIGWSAVAIATDTAGQSWVLWRSTDGRSGRSLHQDGAMLSSFQWAADSDWSVEDIAVGADGKARLLRTAPDGKAEVSTIEANGSLTSAGGYSAPGLKPRRIAAGDDGRTRLLFSGADGEGELVILGRDNALIGRNAIPPEPAGDSGASVTEIPAPGVTSITMAPDGSIWYTAFFQEYGRVDASGKLTSNFLTAGYPMSVAGGPDGNLWFTTSGGKVCRVTPSGTETPFPFPTAFPANFFDAEPTAIVAGPDGNLWFGQPVLGQVGRSTTAGEITEFPVATSADVIAGLAVGPDGNLWFAESLGNRVGRVTGSGTVDRFDLPAGANPTAVAAGPDGNLWFAEREARIGRITTAGEVREYPMPAPVQAIAAGFDGHLWAANSSGLYRVSATGVVTHVPLRQLEKFVVPMLGLVAAPDGSFWVCAYDANTWDQSRGVILHVRPEAPSP